MRPCADPLRLHERDRRRRDHGGRDDAAEAEASPAEAEAAAAAEAEAEAAEAEAEAAVQSPLFVTVVYRASPGPVPFPQLAIAWTFNLTDELLPIENVPENWKSLSLPKRPLPTWVYVAPPSYEAQTPTFGFVRAEVVMLLSFHASAV